MKQRLARYLPMLAWARHYDRAAATKDSLAALIVTLMLIPQSLAYAMLAGLPPVTGLYASMLPLIAYTLFGTSRTLAVGPVAVVSLMTAAALGPLFAQAARNTPQRPCCWRCYPARCCCSWRRCAWASWRTSSAIR